MIQAAMKIDADDARQLGLNPEGLIAGAFVGVAILSDVRLHTREDARSLKRRRAGFRWVSPLLLVGVEETAPYSSDQRQWTTQQRSR